MRNLVQPSRFSHCEHCQGELRFKRIEQFGPEGAELDFETFVCAACGRELSFHISHDRYAARIPGNERHAKFG